MNLDELRAVQDRERDKDSLQHLRDSFYEEVGTYIGDLRAERERAADHAADPFADPEVRRLTEEIETAEEVAESIYERRMGKVVKTASLAAAGYAADTEGLTTEEADLFEDLVDRIEANQTAVLDVLAGDGAGDFGGSDGVAPDDEGLSGAAAGSSDDDAAVSTPDASGSGADASGSGADASGSGAGATGTDSDATAASAAGGRSDTDVAAPDDASTDGSVATTSTDTDPHPESGADDAATAEAGSDRPADEAAAVAAEEGDANGFDAAAVMGDDDRVTLRITEDVGEIVGVDGTAYDLAVDDVVTLPEENAMPLVEKDAATRLE